MLTRAARSHEIKLFVFRLIIDLFCIHIVERCFAPPLGFGRTNTFPQA